jgi:ADP-heptose:LPS heptosyltransferase
VEYNLELVGLIGANAQDKTLALGIKDQNLEGVYDLDRYVVLHPFTSDRVKQWPQERFVELSNRLIKELGIRVAVVGGKEELEKSISLFSNCASGFVNLVGRTDLIQLATVLRKCRLLISGDSGPVHLACAVGTAVIAIFRNDISGKSPRRWGPWGAGSCVIEKSSLLDISVDEVFNKTKEMLG